MLFNTMTRSSQIHIWRLLTRPCGKQFRGPRHRDFELGCNRSTRGTRRKWPRWDNRWGSSVPSRTGQCRDPCLSRSRNRRKSGERFAVSPPADSHLFVLGSRSGSRTRREKKRKGNGQNGRIGTRGREHVEMYVVCRTLFFFANISMWYRFFWAFFYMAYMCEDVPVRIARDGNEEYHEA